MATRNANAIIEEFDDAPTIEEFDDAAAPAAAAAIEEIDDEIVAEEAQRATEGAKQALYVMERIGRADWSEANEKMDQERFREAEAMKPGTKTLTFDGTTSEVPETETEFQTRKNALLSQVSPHTSVGKFLAERTAAEQDLTARAQASNARRDEFGTYIDTEKRTPSESLSRLLGPGLSPTITPIAEGAARQALPAVGGILGAARFIPHPGAQMASQIGLPMLGAIAGSMTGGHAQEALLQIGETPEETQRRQQLATEDQARNPGLTLLGGALASSPFVGPSMAQFGRAAAGDVGAMANLGIGGALNAGGAMVSAMTQGRFADAKEISEAFFLGMAMNEPTKLGRKLGLKPSSEQQAVEDATAAEIAATREVPSIPIGPTSEVGVVAGMRQAPSAIPRRAVPTISDIAPEGVLYRSEKSSYEKPGEGAVFFSGDKSYVDLYHGEGRVLREVPVPENVLDIRDAASRKQMRDWTTSKLTELEGSDVVGIGSFIRNAKQALSAPDSPQNVASAMSNIGLAMDKIAGTKITVGRAEKAFMEDAGVEAITWPENARNVGEEFSIAFRENPKAVAETPATRTDEQRIAELVAAGMTPEEAAAGVARAKAAEVPAAPEIWEPVVTKDTFEAIQIAKQRAGGMGPLRAAFERWSKEQGSYVAGRISKAGELQEFARKVAEEPEDVAHYFRVEKTATTEQTADLGVSTRETPAEPPTTLPPRPAPLEAPQPIGPEPTSNKESVVNAERAQRALDPVIKEAAIENPEVVGYAEDVIAADPQRPQRIIDRLRAAPPEERTISLVDGGILLIERTKLRARRDAALARASRKEGSPMEQAIAQAEFDAAEGQLNAMDQAAQDARSTWGRFGQFWQRSMREDFSLANLERRARLSKDGPLTEKDIKGITAIAEKAKAAHEAFDIRQKQLELESRQSAIEAKIAEVSGKTVDPAVRSLTERIIARLDATAKTAEKNLRDKLYNLGAAPDPTIVIEVAKIAAARTAKASIQFAQWSAEMIKSFGEKVRPFLQAGWDQREQVLDAEINLGGGTKKKQVATRIKTPLNAAAQQARIEQAIGARIAEGKPLSSLAPYVNKLQESFIAQGITQREPLIDAVHGALQKHDPAITRDDAMEIMSKYGSDYATPLSKDPVKQTRRQVDGEIQQLLKLRDIAAKVPLPKSGPERPTPGPTWRNLIKQVNAAKKKLGVVVTDPETQLKSSQDAIRTRLRNDIEDMTLELETGERPPEKTPAEYTQDMEILKGVRDRVRETLRSIDENSQLTDEQRLALTKRSAEESLALWERRLAGETAKAPKQRITSPEIEAIRAKRDAIKAEVEELNAADAVLQENRKAEALVRQIEATEAQLAGNAIRVKAQGADSQLVAEAREQLAAVRAALDTKRANDPLRQAEAIEKAEQALEASIKKLDADLQAGNIATRTKPTRLESDRLIYLRAQRDALNQLRAQLRAEARPRIAADQLAIKMRTTQMLKRAAELRRRIAVGDFGPRTRKAPVDISGDRAALDAQADLMNVDAEFQKLQEQWKLDQMNWAQRRWRNIGQAWDATSNIFLSFDLSTPLQTAFSMASHPIEGVKAIGKGAAAFYQQFIKGSEDYAKREAAKIANSTNAKNGLYKAMKLELPSALGKKREENMASVLEQLADLDAKWAGLPDVVKGLFKLEGRSLVKGAKRLASTPLVAAGRGIKASNSAFETIANTMRARTADAMLARWYGRGRGIPTKQQLELLGEQINIATGKGGLRSGDSVRRLLFAPNYYLSIIKQLTGFQLLKSSSLYHGENQVARDIAREYVRAISTMGVIYGLNWLFGNEVETNRHAKNFGRAQTDRGTAIDLTMGRGSWITTGSQLLPDWLDGGYAINKKGRMESVDRGAVLMNFVKGRLSRGVSTAITSLSGKDYRNRDIEGIEIAKDFMIPLAWRDFDNILAKEGWERGAFIQLLNILGVTHNVHE